MTEEIKEVSSLVLTTDYDKIVNALQFLENEYQRDAKKMQRLGRRMEKLKAGTPSYPSDTEAKLSSKLIRTNENMHKVESGYVGLLAYAQSLGYLEKINDDPRLNKPIPEVEEEIKKRYEEKLEREKERRDAFDGTIKGMIEKENSH